jgi:hypothetical protein
VIFAEQKPGKFPRPTSGNRQLLQGRLPNFFAFLKILAKKQCIIWVFAPSYLAQNDYNDNFFGYYPHLFRAFRVFRG